MIKHSTYTLNPLGLFNIIIGILQTAQTILLHTQLQQVEMRSHPGLYLLQQARSFQLPTHTPQISQGHIQLP